MNYFFNEGVALFESGAFELSVDSFERVLEDDPYMTEAYVYLASAYLALQENHQAVEAAQRGIIRFPKYARLFAIKAEALYRMDPEEAVPVYRQLREIIRQSPVAERNGITLEMVERSLGLVYEQVGGNRYMSGDSDGAVSALRQAIGLIPDSVSVHNNLAYILIDEGRTSEAARVLDEALIQFPNATNLLLMKARISGDAEESASILKQLHEAEPEHVERSIAYGQALLNSHQAVKANEHFEAMIEQYPEEPAYYRALIEINRQRMNMAGLHEVLRMKVKQFPDDRELKEEYGRSFFLRQDFDGAHTWFDSLSNKYDSARLARFAGHALVFAEKNEQALEWYRGLEQRYPENIDVAKEYGLLLEESGLTEKAIRRFTLYTEKRNNGRILLKIASLTPNELEKRRMLDEAMKTSYLPVAKWQLSRLDGVALSAGETATLLDELVGFYTQQSQTLTRQAERDFQQRDPSLPDILHPRKKLEETYELFEDLFLFIFNSFATAEGLEILDTVIQNRPDSAMLFFQRGRLYLENKEADAAIQDFRQAQQLGASGTDIHMETGRAWKQKNNYDQAALAYEQALSEDSHHEQAYRKLIGLSEEFERLDELTDRWLSRYRNNRNTVLREFLIEALHKADRFEEARNLD